jgi:DNA modification methylase
MRRILVVGTSGAGKSTLAEKIAAKLDLPYFATDPFYWQHGWHPSTIDQVESQLSRVLERRDWVLDGNFEHQWRKLWPQADCIVWLDYPLATVLWQVTLRNAGWLLNRQIIWSGNRMTFRKAYSGIRHAFRSHAAKRSRYVTYIAELDGPTVLQFKSPNETRLWLSDLNAN